MSASDGSSSPAEGSRKLASCRGSCAAVRDHLPFADETFDTVTSVALLEHVPRAAAALGEFARVQRPSGRTVVWTSNRYSLTPEPHVRVWGVGFMPRRFMPAFVRWRRGLAYTGKTLVSRFELTRLARRAGFRRSEFPSARAGVDGHSVCWKARASGGAPVRARTPDLRTAPTGHRRVPGAPGRAQPGAGNVELPHDPRRQRNSSRRGAIRCRARDRGRAQLHGGARPPVRVDSRLHATPDSGRGRSFPAGDERRGAESARPSAVGADRVAARPWPCGSPVLSVVRDPALRGEPDVRRPSWFVRGVSTGVQRVGAEQGADRVQPERVARERRIDRQRIQPARHAPLLRDPAGPRSRRPGRGGHGQLPSHRRSRPRRGVSSRLHGRRPALCGLRRQADRAAESHAAAPRLRAAPPGARTAAQTPHRRRRVAGIIAVSTRHHRPRPRARRRRSRVCHPRRDAPRVQRRGSLHLSVFI